MHIQIMEDSKYIHAQIFFLLSQLMQNPPMKFLLFSVSDHICSISFLPFSFSFPFSSSYVCISNRVFKLKHLGRRPASVG